VNFFSSIGGGSGASSSGSNVSSFTTSKNPLLILFLGFSSMILFSLFLYD